ncbi:uncharacterized protein RHOBADRAFT_46711 [Rhodotorula graminis WP1]|uniref:Uncharacterized protein n=1 Tax=Rhodotorula graminis (strain WP1) TaxID=578459 RepID=A0A0P9EU15_RHOGW|nr:uncharacterized protein RHOBADRAFT_46711 [Rhodotorula graminis WP1]KPV72667.1 hypothetical protein RHOBADRAFT_46711 [Rhodotorula graminis WP1]
MPRRSVVLELLAAACGAALFLLAPALAAPLPTASSISSVCSLVQLDGHVLDEPSRAECEHLLSNSDLGAFVDAWATAEAAADDLHGVLVQELRRRNLVDEVCETLTDANSTLNIVSENEPVGVDYKGNGLLDGIALSINPSILSGIFQTTTRTRASATPAPTTTARAIALEGQGLLDGVDITLDPSILRDLANAPSLLKSLPIPSRTASAKGASETGGCEAS